MYSSKQPSVIIVDPVGLLITGPPQLAFLFDKVSRTKTWGEWSRWETVDRAGLPDSVAIVKELGTGVSPDGIRECIKGTLRGLNINKGLLDALHGIKSKTTLGQPGSPELRIYSISRLPNKFQASINKTQEWTAVIDGSFYANEGFGSAIKTGLEHVKARPTDTLLITTNKTMAFISEATGVRAIVAKWDGQVVRELTNMLHKDPQTRGREYLHSRARELFSTSTDLAASEMCQRDNLSQLLILHALGDVWDVVNVPRNAASMSWNLLDVGESDLLGDIGTCALAHLVLDTSTESKGAAMNYIARRVQWIFTDANSTFADIVPFATILWLFYCNGRSFDVPQISKWVSNIVANGFHYQILGDTEAGPSRRVEMFLYFLACLVTDHVPWTTRWSDELNLEQLNPLLFRAIQGHVVETNDALGIALVILARQKLGIESDHLVPWLKRLQEADGSWEPGVVAVFGPAHAVVYNRGVATAFAVKALEEAERIANEKPKTMLENVARILFEVMEFLIPGFVNRQAPLWMWRAASFVKRTTIQFAGSAWGLAIKQLFGGMEIWKFLWIATASCLIGVCLVNVLVFNPSYHMLDSPLAWLAGLVGSAISLVPTVLLNRRERIHQFNSN